MSSKTLEYVRVEHIFRHEYGKLVAMLSQRIGISHVEVIEDAVQWSLAQALEFWCKKGIPTNPSAWLYQVAYRQVLTTLRDNKRHHELLTLNNALDANEAVATIEKGHDSSVSDVHNPQQLVTFSGELNDAMLRMLFVACHENMPIESQLVFTLKSLCGFSIKEIALRLFISEANAYKRFTRAKHYLKRQGDELSTLTDEEMKQRLPTVHRILYLVFNEGYLSSLSDTALRKDLCEEAIHLTQLLVDSTLGNTPEGYALLALMNFHIARLASRTDDVGALLLLEQQDRNQWNRAQIEQGMRCLEKSASGETLSRYHVEAGIAAEHCLAVSFEETCWKNIIAAYLLLEKISPSPLHILNRAIATAQGQSAQAGLAVLSASETPSWLDKSYYWYAVKAYLYSLNGEHQQNQAYAQRAIDAAPSDHIKQLLTQRFLIDDLKSG